MTKNKHNRIARLEAQTGFRKWRYVLPLCCFYGTTNKKCDCYRHYTQTPPVLMKGMHDFYAQVGQPCETMPSDALNEQEFKEMGVKL